MQVAEEKMDFDFVDALSLRVSAQLLRRILGMRGPMLRMLSFANPTDRSRCAATSSEFATLESARRSLAVEVFQGGRANLVAQRALLFLSARERCHASFSCKGWTSLTNPKTYAKQFAESFAAAAAYSRTTNPPLPPMLPFALDLVLLMDVSVPSCRLMPDVIKEATRTLVSKLPGLFVHSPKPKPFRCFDLHFAFL